MDWLLRYDTLNSLFQTYLLMFSTTLTCALTQGFSYKKSGETSSQIGGIYVALGITLLVHLNQFVGMAMQIFAKADLRNNNPKFLNIIQIVFVFIFPVLLIVMQMLLLIFTRNRRHDIYFVWTIADIVLNIQSSLNYVTVLQNFYVE